MKSRIARWTLMAAVMIGAAQVATAGSASWNVTGGGSWSTPGNWTAGGPPGAGDTATFTGTVAQTVNIDVNPQNVNTVNVVDSAPWIWDTVGNALTVASLFTYSDSNTGSVFKAILAGAMSGGGLVVNAGRLYLQNINNSFSGGININGGAVAAGDDASPRPLGSGTQTINIGDTAAGNTDAALMLSGHLGSPWITYTNPIVVRANNSGKAAIEIYRGEDSGAKLIGTITLNKDLSLISDCPGKDARLDLRTLWVNGVISGTGNLIKEGPGCVRLDQGNSYNGQTVVKNGRLEITGGGPTYNGNILVNGGLLAAYADAGLGTAGNAITLGSAGRFGGLGGSGGSLTSSRGITLSGNGGFLASDQSITLSGAISGSGMLLGTSEGTVTLSGPNTYSGGTRIANGTYQTTAGNNNAMFGQGDVAIVGRGVVYLYTNNNVAAGRTVSLQRCGTDKLALMPALVMREQDMQVVPTIDTNSTGFLAFNQNGSSSNSAAVGALLSLGLADGTLGNLFVGSYDNASFTFTSMAIGAGNTYRLASHGSLSMDTWGGFSGQLLDKSGPANVLIGTVADIDGKMTGGTVWLSGGDNQTWSGTTTVIRSWFRGSARNGVTAFGGAGPVNLLSAGWRVDPVGGGSIATIKGALSYEGTCEAQVYDDGGAINTNTLTVGSLSRLNRGILLVNGGNGRLGNTEQIFVSGGVSSVSNMVAPAVLNYSADFVNYGAGGFTNVVYTVNGVAGNASSQPLYDTTVPTDIVNATVDLDLTTGKTNYALKTSGALGGTGTLVLNGNGLILTGGGNKIHTANLQFPGEGVIYQKDTDFITLRGTITASGGLTFAANGPKTLNLYGNNGATLTGDIVLDGCQNYGGTVVITNDNALGASGNQVVLNGGSLQANQSGMTVAHGIRLGENGGSLKRGGTYSGKITGTGPLTFVGYTVPLISNTGNDYTGGTIIQDPIIVANGATLGTGPIIVQNGDTYLQVDGDACLATNRLIADRRVFFQSQNPAVGSLEGGRNALGKRGSQVWMQNSNPSVLSIGGNNLSTEFYGQIFEYTANSAYGYSPAGSGIKKVGTGTFTLWGENPYSGATVVTQGTLMVNGWINTNGTVKVYAGATLDGIGTVGIVSNLAGTVQGNLYMRRLNLGAGSSLAVSLSGTNVVSQFAQLHVSETVTLAGTLSLSLNYAPQVGQSFTILNNASGAAITGQFAGGQVTITTYNGKTYAFGVNYAGGDGNDIVITSLPQGTVIYIR